MLNGNEMTALKASPSGTNVFHLTFYNWTRVRNEQQVNRKRISETMRTNCQNDLRGRFEPAVCQGAVDWMKCACWMLVPKPQMCSTQLSVNIGFDKKLRYRYSIHRHLPATPKAIDSIGGATGAPLPMITIWIIQMWFGVDSIGIFGFRRMHAEAYLIGTTASEHRWIINLLIYLLQNAEEKKKTIRWPSWMGRNGKFICSTREWNIAFQRNETNSASQRKGVFLPFSSADPSTREFRLFPKNKTRIMQIKSELKSIDCECVVVVFPPSSSSSIIVSGAECSHTIAATSGRW